MALGDEIAAEIRRLTDEFGVEYPGYDALVWNEVAQILAGGSSGSVAASSFAAWRRGGGVAQDGRRGPQGHPGRSIVGPRGAKGITHAEDGRDGRHGDPGRSITGPRGRRGRDGITPDVAKTRALPPGIGMQNLSDTLTTMRANISALQSAGIPLGTNTAGIKNSATDTNPPDFLAGAVDVIGTAVTKTSLTSLSLTTNAFRFSRQALDASQGYRVMEDTAGNLYWLLAFGAAVPSHTGNILSISYSSGTATLTKSTGTIGTETNYIVVVNGTTTGDGVYLITGGNGSSTITYKSTGTTSGAAGTYTIYEAMQHSVYGWEPIYSATYNQYVIDARGIPGVTNTATYRDMGMFFTNASSRNVLAVAYGFGSSKHNDRDGNDNWNEFPSVAAGTLITATTTAPSYGTVGLNKAFWRRVGDSAEIMWSFYQSTAGATGTGTYLFNLPVTLTANTTKTGTVNTTPGQAPSVGDFKSNNNVQTNVYSGAVTLYSATQFACWMLYQGTGGTGGTGLWGSALGNFNLSPQTFALRATVPIAQFAV